VASISSPITFNHKCGNDEIDQLNEEPVDIDLSISSPMDRSVQRTSESKGGVDKDLLSWRVKFEMMGTDLQEMMKRGQGDPRKWRE